jgi:hypothetical protein
VTGGAVFVAVVLLGAIIYFTLGVGSTWIKTGVPELPNVGFWMEVAECISTAVQWILSCGKRERVVAEYESLGSPTDAI